MGTEAFWVPAALAAVSAAGEGVNQMNANKRAQNSTVQAMDSQNQFRSKANDQVKKMTQDVATSTPNAIAAKEQGDFVNTLRKNSAGSATPNASSALAPVAGGSSRYNAGTKAAQSDVQNYGNTNAGQESAVDAAVRQRQNEATSLGTLGTNLNTLAAQSQTKAFVDQLRTQSAAQTSPWVSMMSGILKGAAGGLSKNGWFSGGTPAADTGGNVLGNGGIGGAAPGNNWMPAAPNYLAPAFR